MSLLERDGSTITTLKKRRVFQEALLTQDNRLWRPDTSLIEKPGLTWRGDIAPVVAAPQPRQKRNDVPSGLRYADPRRVINCYRRQLRREVIFAVGHGGRKGRKRQYRQTNESHIKC